MKLVIKEGTHIDDAVKMLAEFLQGNYTEYPYLKKTTNIYITLRDQNGKICPDNEQEFRLSEDGYINVCEVEKMTAKSECLRMWKTFVAMWPDKIKSAERSLKCDIKYLETAEEKGRKPENIARKMKDREEHEKEVNELKRRYQFICELDQAVQEKKYITHFIKYVGKSPYDYSYEAAIQFEDINGYTGYFKRFGLHEGKL